MFKGLSMEATVPDHQRSKTGAGAGIAVVRGDRKSHPKIHCKTTRNFFPASSENWATSVQVTFEASL